VKKLFERARNSRFVSLPMLSGMAPKSRLSFKFLHWIFGVGIAQLLAPGYNGCQVITYSVRIDTGNSGIVLESWLDSKVTKESRVKLLRAGSEPVNWLWLRYSCCKLVSCAKAGGNSPENWHSPSSLVGNGTERRQSSRTKRALEDVW